MDKQTQVYGIFVVILSLAPVMRDLIGMMFVTTPGPVLHDTFWHTFLEVLFMLALTTVLALFHAGLARKNSEKVRMTQIVSIEALASLAEFRDEETASHLRRIRRYVDVLVTAIDRSHAYWSQISKTANYSQDISDAAVLHDIGKIAVHDAVLLKPGPLSKEEFEEVKRHTVLGAEALGEADNHFMEQLGRSSYLRLAQRIARSHHERWDGNGYPDSLRGKAIPLSARIVAICDVYDALTSDRVYKKAWSHEKAITMITENRGSQFDPLLTDLMLANAEHFRTVRQSIV